MTHRSFSLLQYAHAPTTGRLAKVPASAAAASLTRVVTDLARNVETWMGRVRLGTDDRWYERLCDGPDYDVWAISWMPGQSTGFHDHGGSSGVFLVVSGELQERRPGAESLVVSAGDVRTFGPQYVHDVGNVSSAPAISLHAYSPALNAMTHYEVEGGELRRTHERRRDSEPGCGVDELLSAARGRLRRLTPAQAYDAVESGIATLVDIRPARQRAEEGIVPGALLIERNVLEWRLDPTSRHRLPVATGHDQRIIVLCSEGYASSLAAASLQKLGLWRSTDVIGGFKAWQAAGLPTTHATIRGGCEEPSATDHLRPGRVTTAWLAAHLDDPGIRIVESSGDGTRYEDGHIPGAVHVKWAAASSGDGGAGCVTRATFDALMSRMGATPETTVVFYGDDDNRWASCTFALFQLFGHANLRSLDGGRARWIRERRPLSTDAPSFVPTRYRSADEHDAPERVSHEDVLIAAEGRALLDERQQGRAFPGLRLHLGSAGNAGPHSA